MGNSELVLNGAGLRKKVVFKVYVAGLYLAERKQNPADVLALGGPKRISITLLRSVTARELVDALYRGIRANNSLQECQAVEARLDRLAAILLALQQGERGDVVSFDWLPGTGTHVLMNGEAKGEAISGGELYCVLLRVWLGERPTSASLKRSLLGRRD